MRNNNNFVSVVIVTYNSQYVIKENLEGLLENSVSEVFVIDNSSNDRTVEIVKNFPNVTLVENKENIGFGRANNIGARKSSLDYILFLNPDTIVEKGSIADLANYLDQNISVAAIGPALSDENGKIQPERASLPTLLTEILVLTNLHKLSFFRRFVYAIATPETIVQVDHLMGAALMIRREVFDEVGGFDEKFFLWFEETDLLKRVKDKEHKIVYYPKSKVVHIGSQSSKLINSVKRQHIWNRSLLYYFRKHYGYQSVLVLLPFVLFSYVLAAIKMMVGLVRS